MNLAKWQKWIEENRDRLTSDGTTYELLFAEEVLSTMEDLDPRCVTAQREFTDQEGKQRRIDFAVVDGKHVRVAIEIDGWDKTGRREGMSPDEFSDWSLRELSLVADGWTVLRFANSLVKNKPELCRKVLELTLRAAFDQAEEIASKSELGKELVDLREATTRAARRTNLDEPGGEHELEEIRSIQLSQQDRVFTPDEQNEFRQLQAELAAANDQLQREANLRRATDKENKGMKIMGVAIALVAAAFVAYIALGRDGSGPDPEPTTTNSIAVVPTSSPSCDEAVPYQQLTNAQLNSVLTVRGEVAQAVRNSGSGPSVYLNLGAPFPDHTFAVVIWDDDVANWSTSPEDKYDNRTIAVKGLLGEYGGRYQIVANSPNDLTICR